MYIVFILNNDPITLRVWRETSEVNNPECFPPTFFNAMSAMFGCAMAVAELVDLSYARALSVYFIIMKFFKII